MSRFHTLQVKAVLRDTPDSVAVELAVPAELEAQFAFVPGQYLTLRTTVDGEDVRRPYSICSGRTEGALRVGIKKVAGGRFSTFANEELAAGDTLQVMPPTGHFEWLAPPTEGVRHLGFAAGSGITPILSIAKSVLEERPDDHFTLFYGNRTQASVMFLDALHDLKDRFMGRFRIVHLLTREATDVELLHGRLDRERVRALAEAGLFDPARTDVAYVCGPGEMIDEVERGLVELGVAKDRIRAERFTPAPGTTPRKMVAIPTLQGAEVEAVLDGTRRAFTVQSDEDVIHAAARQGIELPYSCAGGMCCTCRCKVLEGEVDMAVNYSLEPWELEAGFVLACQSRAKTDRVVLDFDAL